MEYEFTLIFKLPPTTDVEAMVERLAEAGCNDGLVGIGMPGRVGLKFTREADSAHVALISAIQNVKSAIPDAQLIEAAPEKTGQDTLGRKFILICPSARCAMPAFTRRTAELIAAAEGGSPDVAVALAVQLFHARAISLGPAARLARLPRHKFLTILASQGIPAVAYDPAELDAELALLSAIP